MPTGETKHDKFMRLAQKRVTRAMNELRLVSQLASPNYEFNPEEVEEIVSVLDGQLLHIANVFGVEYATRIGKAVSQTTNGAQAVGGFSRKIPVMDAVFAMEVLEHIKQDRKDEAMKLLRSAVTGSK